MRSGRYLAPAGAWRFIILLGVISLFSDVTYEGARSISGPFLAELKASAAVVGVVGGVLLGGVSGVSIAMSEIGLKALAVVILGGLDSIGGAIFAGLMLGIMENLAAGYLDPLMPSGGGLAGVFPFIVMILVLMIKPHGLFGLKRIERV